MEYVLAVVVVLSLAGTTAVMLRFSPAFGIDPEERAFETTLHARRVVVNTKEDTVFKGIYWARRGPLVVLKNADLLQPGKEPVRVDGEVVVERSNIDFIQVIGTAE